MPHLTELYAWQALTQHHQDIAGLHMRRLFSQDPQRFERFSLQLGDILFDFSKNRITEKTIALLCYLARQAELPQSIDSMFSGQKINYTENRAVLHIALRNRGKPAHPCRWTGRDARGQQCAGKDAHILPGCPFR